MNLTGARQAGGREAVGIDGGEHDAANVCAQGDVAEDRSDLLRYARRSLLVGLFCSLASLFFPYHL